MRLMDEEQLVTALLAFVGERTGLSMEQVTAVFDANDLFWEHHTESFRALLHGKDTYESEE